MSQEGFEAFKSFDVSASQVSLWVFKRSGTTGYRAKFLRTDLELDDILKAFALREQARIREWAPYSYISQTTEVGCLSILAEDTNFAQLQELVRHDDPRLEVAESKDLKGVIGYLVKLTYEDKVLFCGRRAPSSWKATYRKKGLINVIF